MGEWISVKDRLPPEETNVILFDGNEVFCGNFFFSKNKSVCWGIQSCDSFCYGNYEKNEITHWMPLPSSPDQ